MVTTTHTGRYDLFVGWGRAGTRQDVDRLMEALVSRDDLATSKLVDFALGLVRTREGMVRVEDYLFRGNQVQRNFATLYFKRRGLVELIDEAVQRGLVDREQAYSK